MRRLPPLSALPSFEATARLGSVTAASEELGRTHGAVSKQIRRLGEDLGGGLFEKCGNGLRLTTRGERLRQSITPLLDELSASSHALRSEMDNRLIVVGTSATLATRWLTPRLPRFYARHPQFEVRLVTVAPIPVQDHEIDVLLSYDRLRGRVGSDDHTSLGDARYGPVCVPDYVRVGCCDEWFAPTRLIQSNAAQTWDAWERLSGKRIQADRVVEVPHHFLALEAACAGMGVALAEERLVAKDMAARQLVAPLGFIRVSGGFHAVLMPRARSRAPAAALIDWLLAEAVVSFT